MTTATPTPPAALSDLVPLSAAAIQNAVTPDLVRSRAKRNPAIAALFKRLGSLWVIPAADVPKLGELLKSRK